MIKTRIILSATLLALVGGVLLAMPLGDEITGKWSYEVMNVDPEYRTGVLTITKEDGVYKATINAGYEDQEVQNLVVKDREISFEVNVEGSLVEVSMTFDGDQMKGRAVAEDGVYSMKGTRQT